MSKEIFFNPDTSKLGFRAYKSFASETTERGSFNIWFQPPLELLNEIHNPLLSLQIKQATILPNKERGNHYHSFEKAIDCFYLEKGTAVLGLQHTNNGITEFYQIPPLSVCFFPAFIAHTVWNKGADELRFTTFRTWNYAIKKYTEPYEIYADDDTFEMALKGEINFDSNGLFGLKKQPTTQIKLD